jgi:uncharacterized repeat protein (TIGR03806 family)
MHPRAPSFALVNTISFAALCACSSEPGATFGELRSQALNEQASCAPNAAVTSTLPCAEWRVQAPFHNIFDGSLPGMVDAAGTPTGFSMALATRSGNGHVPAQLLVRPAQGELDISASPGIAASTADTQDNALGVGIALPNGVFRVDATLLRPPSGSGAYEQAGVWFGIGQRNYIKLVLMSAPDALTIQASLEENDVARAPLYGSLPALPERLRLSLELDPQRREARAYALVDDGPERLIGSFADVPESWLGIGPEGQAAFAGVMATARHRAAVLEPLTFSFGDFRVTRDLGLPDEPDALGAGYSVEPALAGATFDNPTSLLEAPGTGQLLVTEREGRVYAVPAAGGDKTLVLDLSAVTQGYQDLGLLGLALHPRFGDRGSQSGGYMYLHYAHADQPMPPPVTLDAPTDTRLSRFTVDLDTLTADPASELVLISQQDENVWHQGGAMFFGPTDGFLYLSMGDEGGSLCVLDNCQRVDRDLFSGVLRIDVDQRGGEVSHPIQRQPETGFTGNYFIPNDNPFVGEDALEEFYAIGLRSPHRMTHDAVDDITWIGDVGQNHEEELDVLAPGANFQWNLREGNFERLQMSEAPLGVWTDPVLSLPRDESMALIGGVVYRGQGFPELNGKYIFGDYVYGNIWALTYERDAFGVRVLERQRLLSGMLGRSGTISSFGVDAAGELYVLAMGGSSRVLRLVRSNPRATVPARLSELGAFLDVSTLEPAPDLVPYSVASPLFSDGASKQRWLLLPEGGRIGFSESGPFSFPEGSVFIKHFELAVDEREPQVRRRLETRFLVAAKGGYYGISYKWNADGSDAEPVFDSALEEIDVIDASGNLRQQRYYYPSPSDCMVCHNADAGFVLGVRAAQLNGAHADTEQNQLLAWSERGLLDPPLDAVALAALPSLAGLDDETRSAEDRVRSYLDANCSMCHGPIPDQRSRWDARYQTPLEQQGIILGPLSGEAELPEGTLVVTPGDPAHSALWLRDGSNDPALRMPPIGRQSVDQRYLELLEQWILSLPAPVVNAPAP